MFRKTADIEKDKRIFEELDKIRAIEEKRKEDERKAEVAQKAEEKRIAEEKRKVEQQAKEIKVLLSSISPKQRTRRSARIVAPSTASTSRELRSKGKSQSATEKANSTSPLPTTVVEESEDSGNDENNEDIPLPDSNGWIHLGSEKGFLINAFKPKSQHVKVIDNDWTQKMTAEEIKGKSVFHF